MASKSQILHRSCYSRALHSKGGSWFWAVFSFDLLYCFLYKIVSLKVIWTLTIWAFNNGVLLRGSIYRGANHPWLSPAFLEHAGRESCDIRSFEKCGPRLIIIGSVTQPIEDDCLGLVTWSSMWGFPAFVMPKWLVTKLLWDNYLNHPSSLRCDQRADRMGCSNTLPRHKPPTYCI